jgi:hypothetical protein
MRFCRRFSQSFFRSFLLSIRAMKISHLDDLDWLDAPPDNLIIEESRGTAPEAEAAELLAQKAFEIGVDHFVEKSALEYFLARLTFARLESPDLLQTLRTLVPGTSKLWDLRSASKNFIPLLEEKLNIKLLDEIVPSEYSPEEWTSDQDPLRRRSECRKLHGSVRTTRRSSSIFSL